MRNFQSIRDSRSSQGIPGQRISQALTSFVRVGMQSTSMARGPSASTVMWKRQVLGGKLS